jgi:uncharacterized membrane protein YhaH (DUF805 family)
MTFPESIKTGLSKLMEFSGRASRSEYWWFSLFVVLVLALLVVGIELVYRLGGDRVPYGTLVVLLVPLYLALVSVQVRRLRDAGFSPWWTLVNLIPYVGVPLVLVLTLLPGGGRDGGQDGPESTQGSLSTLSIMMVSGWGALTGGAALSGEKPKPRSWLPLIGVVLLAAAVFVVVYLGYQEWRDSRRPPAPAPVPVAPAPPQAESSLSLIDETSGARLYYDKSSVRLAGPGMISIQLVFDFAQPRERDGVRFHSLKQNEAFDCAVRTSSWSTRFYMSEPLGEGAAVLIEEGTGSLLDMSDSEIRNQRLDTVCKLLPGPDVPTPAAATGN